METFNWREFLQQWSLAMIAAKKDSLPREVIEARWLGYPGATEEQIVATETRLGTKLPPSYRRFLKVSNGWRQTTPFIYKLWSTQEIEWYRVRHQEEIDAYTEGVMEGASYSGQGLSVPDEVYLRYGDKQDRWLFRVEYLPIMLEVSASGDAAIYLLNPQIVTPDGEWEAWILTSWNGATRYRSFQALMEKEYNDFRHVTNSPST